MKKSEITLNDLVIHKQRLCEEMMLQRMIKTECLKDKTVNELKELSSSLWITISNMLYDIEESGIKYIVTDDIANNPNFINSIISKTFEDDMTK